MPKAAAVLLKKNDLLQWNEETGENVICRVLWLDRRQDSVFVIDINAGDVFPELKRISQLLIKVTEGSAVKLSEDPWAKPVDERSIGATTREAREKAWKVISDIVSPPHEPDIYFRDRRGLLVKKAAQEHGVTVKTVYKYLRKYWQRGKNKNALLPDYDKSGGRGKFKRAGDKKRGRPRNGYAGTGSGINIDEKIRKIIAAVIAEEAGNPGKESVRKAYDRMLTKYYVNQISFRGADGKPVPLPGAKVPTYIQFKYWSKMLVDTAEFDLNNTRFIADAGNISLPEAETAVSVESALENDSSDKLDAYIMQGFQAKIAGRLGVTADYFKAALKLNPPLELQVMLVLDLAAVLKETGRYSEALTILAGFKKERGLELLPEVLQEVSSNLQYIEILQEILTKTNTPPLPFSKIPTIIKVGVQRKLDETGPPG